MKGAYFAAVSPRETYLASSRLFAKEIVLWSIPSGEQVKTFAGHESGTHAVIFSADERRMASIGKDGHIKIWDVAREQRIGQCDLEFSEFHNLSFLDDEQVVVELDQGQRSIALTYGRPG